MKKTLLLMAFNLLTLPIITNSQRISNDYKWQLQQQTNSITWSFNEEDNSELVETTYYKKQVYQRTLFTTIDVGIYPWNLTRMSIIADSDCYTKASWGQRSYYGTTIAEFIENKNFVDIAENAIVTDDNIASISNHELLNVKDYHNSAVFITKEFIGFAWHYNSDLNAYILALTFYFYAETWGSLVGGGMWMNIGQGIKIELNN